MGDSFPGKGQCSLLNKAKWWHISLSWREAISGIAFLSFSFTTMSRSSSWLVNFIYLFHSKKIGKVSLNPPVSGLSSCFTGGLWMDDVKIGRICFSNIFSRLMLGLPCGAPNQGNCLLWPGGSSMCTGFKKKWMGQQVSHIKNKFSSNNSGPDQHSILDTNRTTQTTTIISDQTPLIN